MAIRPCQLLIGPAAWVGIVSLCLAGCGTTRSAAAVCHVFNTAGVALHNHYEDLARSGDLLGSLAAVPGAPGRLADLMAEEEAVAPSNIAPSFKTLSQTYRQMGSSEASGLGGLASDLTLGLNAQGASEHVNAYLAQHCHLPQ
jgi:hypothetical protein